MRSRDRPLRGIGEPLHGIFDAARDEGCHRRSNFRQRDPQLSNFFVDWHSPLLQFVFSRTAKCFGATIEAADRLP